MLWNLCRMCDIHTDCFTSYLPRFRLPVSLIDAPAWIGERREKRRKKKDGDDAMPWCSRVSNSLAFCNHLVILINIVQCSPPLFITTLWRSYTCAFRQKSSNNEFQRKTYFGRNKVPLCKPFTICTTDGYVVDMLGPYPANVNDVEILRTLF